MESLYTSAYAIRALARATGVEIVVGPLEGLWASANPASFTARDKDSWDWTMLIAIPDAVAEDHVHEGLAAAATTKPQRIAGRDRRSPRTGCRSRPAGLACEV